MRSSHPEELADHRHRVLRGDETSAPVLTLRSVLTHCFRNHFFDKGFHEVTPPTMVQTQVEGGSTLFKFNFFGEDAYLTQSSQLYLEAAMPALGKVFCVAQSYRAEKSRTRRHLAEYTHFEGEMAFIKFDDLLVTLEDMVVDVCERVMKRVGPAVLKMNPGFKVPKKPFKRMDYTDAVKYCREHKIYKDEEKKIDFEFGDDIPEGPERKMTDMIGEPILLCRFPAHMKSFYMQKCGPENKLTESVDLLMPTVGEIVGGSMRSWDHKALMQGFKHEKINPDPYYWYTDLRKYGSCPHGGWGLGLERFMCWLLNRFHIREVTLFPRHIGRCTP
jgi:asparaginyl-tRNA synthetase